MIKEPLPQTKLQNLESEPRVQESLLVH